MVYARFSCAGLWVLLPLLAMASPGPRRAAHPPSAQMAPARMALPPATVGKRYSYDFHLAIGSATAKTPFTYAVGAGAMPACLQLTTEGKLAGTPEAKCHGTYGFVVVLTSYDGEQVSSPVLLHIEDGGESGEAPQRSDAGAGGGGPAAGASVDIKVLDGSVTVSAKREAAGAAKPSATAQKDPVPDCGLLITGVLPDGATDVRGRVNPEVADDSALIAFCRSRSNEQQAEPGTCSKGAGPKVVETHFEALDGAEDSYYVSPKKDGTFAAKLLVPLSYGDSLNALLVKYGKKCEERPFGVADKKKDEKKDGDGTLDKAGEGKGKEHVAGGNGAVSDAGPQAETPEADAEKGLHTSAFVQVSGGASGVPGKGKPFPQVEAPASPMVEVAPGADWGRIRATFVAGILLANDSSQLSSAHQFYDFLVEKYWLLPGCYRPSAVFGSKACLNDAGDAVQENWLERYHPGINTYFETRLTAIPVSSNPSTSAVGSSTTTGSSRLVGAATTTTTTTTSTGNFLTTQKTARVGVGAQLPFLVTRWDWRKTPNALFLGPVAKVGFDTLAGSLAQNVVGPDGGSTQTTYERLYNYYSFGGRIGHFVLTNSEATAPEWQSFLDVVVGRFSNLQSYICEPMGRKPSTFTSLTNSQCAGAYGPGSYVDSLKRPYRLDLEGALKVPYLPLLLGFNANMGQHAISTGHIDPAFNTPDDLRFLFGTKFDVASFVTKLGMPQAKK